MPVHESTKRIRSMKRGFLVGFYRKDSQLEFARRVPCGSLQIGVPAGVYRDSCKTSE